VSAAVSRRELKFLSDVAQRISGADDFAQFVSLAGRAQIVPIGEASHGTHDFDARATDAAAHNESRFPNYFLGSGLARHAAGASLCHGSFRRALGDFRRFPAWMWCNK